MDDRRVRFGKKIGPGPRALGDGSAIASAAYISNNATTSPEYVKYRYLLRLVLVIHKNRIWDLYCLICLPNATI